MHHDNRVSFGLGRSQGYNWMPELCRTLNAACPNTVPCCAGGDTHSRYARSVAVSGAVMSAASVTPGRAKLHSVTLLSALSARSPRRVRYRTIPSFVRSPGPPQSDRWANLRRVLGMQVPASRT